MRSRCSRASLRMHGGYPIIPHTCMKRVMWNLPRLHSGCREQSTTGCRSLNFSTSAHFKTMASLLPTAGFGVAPPLFCCGCTRRRLKAAPAPDLRGRSGRSAPGGPEAPIRRRRFHERRRLPSGRRGRLPGPCERIRAAARADRHKSGRPPAAPGPTRPFRPGPREPGNTSPAGCCCRRTAAAAEPGSSKRPASRSADTSS